MATYVGLPRRDQVRRLFAYFYHPWEVQKNEDDSGDDKKNEDDCKRRLEEVDQLARRFAELAGLPAAAQAQPADSDLQRGAVPRRRAGSHEERRQTRRPQNKARKRPSRRRKPRASTAEKGVEEEN
jgi:hypothetical protein